MVVDKEKVIWCNTGAQKSPKEQLIAVVLQAAPNDCASALTGEQAKQGKNLELSHLRAVMNTHHRAVCEQTGKNDDDDELALVGADGHKNHNLKQGKEGKKRFTGNCHECGKKEHMARDCWLNPKNKDKCPKWFDEEKFKRNNEVALVALTTPAERVKNYSW